MLKDNIEKNIKEIKKRKEEKGDFFHFEFKEEFEMKINKKKDLLPKGV